MHDTKTDRDWEWFGSTDPYFGVLTHEKYHAANLTESALAEFFRSGEQDLDNALMHTRELFGASFRPARALDFGCGVGRVVIPMARVAASVVGVDVSRSMLREAEKNCRSRAIANVELLEPDAFFARTDLFDLIHSYIVFQHIPVARGEQIFRRLLDRLDEGGVCVAHFTYRAPPLRRVASFIRDHVPFGRHVAAWIRRRPPDSPAMQMNQYDLNRLCSMVQAAGIGRVHVLFTDHGGYLGAVLYCRREARGG